MPPAVPKTFGTEPPITSDPVTLGEALIKWIRTSHPSAVGVPYQYFPEMKKSAVVPRAARWVIVLNDGPLLCIRDALEGLLGTKGKETVAAKPELNDVVELLARVDNRKMFVGGPLTRDELTARWLEPKFQDLAA